MMQDRMRSVGGAAMKLKTPLVLLALVIALGGCSRLSRSIGLNRSAPDEFAVVSKAPLVVPPDFNLRPPDPRNPYAADVDPQELAFKALFPDGGSLPKASKGETALLALTGANATDPDARHGLIANDLPAARKGAFTRDILYGKPTGGDDAPIIERQPPTPVGQ